MKAKELMLGDWIDTAEGPQKVTAVFADGEVQFEKDGTTFRVFEDADDEESFAPVPLTLEILEKNGFKDDVSNHALTGYKTYNLIFGRYNDRWYKLFETQIGRKWGVHDLQHALRLCGITKEIVLSK